MFGSDEEVNYVINYSKKLVDFINQNKTYPKELKQIQYLIFAGFISYYGFESISEIYKLFQLTEFIYTKGSLSNILDKNIIKEKKFGLIKSNVPALYMMDIKYNGKYDIQRKIYISNTNFYNNYNDILLNCIHEANHGLNSIISPICKYDGKMAARTGVKICFLGENIQISDNLEEAFNTIQTAEIMKHILNFKNYSIEDANVRYILYNLNNVPTFVNEMACYQKIVPLIRPLYYNAKLYPFLKEKRLNGDIKFIKENFDEKVGDGSFLDLSHSVDVLGDVNKTIFSDMKQAFKIKKLVKSYNGK